MMISLLFSLALAGQVPPTGASEAPTNDDARWSSGPSNEPGFFPIAVWLQAPRNAERFKEAGINL
jgi:hypothetical protein